MERMFSPWRLRYVSSARKRNEPCVFCRAVRRRRDRTNLILFRGQSNYVILNKYPYNNGHLMIVPVAHLASPQQASAESLTELMEMMLLCEAALRKVYRPTGVNMGMNLGRSAGAGIEEHYHLHVVPRWDGDTNFMTVVGETRVIPEALAVTYRRLHPLFRAPGHAAPRATARHRRPARRRDVS